MRDHSDQSQAHGEQQIERADCDSVLRVHVGGALVRVEDELVGSGLKSAHQKLARAVSAFVLEYAARLCVRNGNVDS